MTFRNLADTLLSSATNTVHILLHYSPFARDGQAAGSKLIKFLGVVCIVEMLSGCRERAWQNFGMATDTCVNTC